MQTSALLRAEEQQAKPGQWGTVVVGDAKYSGEITVPQFCGTDVVRVQNRDLILMIPMRTVSLISYRVKVEPKVGTVSRAATTEVGRLIAACCEAAGVTESCFMSRVRTREAALSRALVSYLAKERLPHVTVYELAAMMQKDRTTVNYGIKWMRDKLPIDAWVQMKHRHAVQLLDGWTDETITALSEYEGQVTQPAQP